MRKCIVSGFMLFLVASASAVFACENCGCQLAKAVVADDPVVAVQANAAPVAAAAVVNAGNKFCPVMGGPVSEDSPNKVEYKGKLYNLCCSGCKDAFLKDPEAALKKMAVLEAAAKK
jgi:YHS domain-containing protein